MSKRNITIEEVPNIIDDHLLDIIGNEFKFDHSKGMAELLKNSVDAYRTTGVHQDNQHVVFRFSDQGVPHPIIECIDFIGMEKTDIEKAFKRWGDPNAARRGKKIKVYGGHGNGGKFYMRQMFRESRFITYKNGLLNIFGFSENKKYGYAKGYEGKTMPPQEAIDLAEISLLPLPTEIKDRVLRGETGFTVVQGIAPEGIKNKFRIDRELDRFKNHPQSRRILDRSHVSVIYNGESYNALLRSDSLEPLQNFEEPRVLEVPQILTTKSGTEAITVSMANDKYPAGKLILRTSSEAMARGSKLGELNRIDILGEIGVIGSYQLSELGVTGWPQAAFIYGDFGPSMEGDTSILEDPENDCVSNDRSKLVSNDTTRALLEWIASEIDKLANEIGAVERENQKANQKEITSKFNDVLNEWKNKHMGKIFSDLFGAGNRGDGGGGGPTPPPGPGPKDITLPPNGFDFKYPKADIQLGAPARVTLKINVPQVLPIGATIFFSSNSEQIILDDKKVPIKSEFLKSSQSGQEVAFLNVGVVGHCVGATAEIRATAGKLTATMTLVVVPEKEEKKGKSFPQVLLSGQSIDPLGLAPDGILILGERDPVVYQRPQDVAENIYWINTASPLASKIYDRFTSDSVQWRNFLFERYVDIFIKEAIHDLEQKDYQSFSADSVDQKISEVVRRVHESARDDLEQFLFDASY